jgi:hypothetical protein
MRAVLGAVAILIGMTAFAHAEDNPNGKCYEAVSADTKAEDFTKSLQGCEGKIVGIDIDVSDTVVNYEQFIAMKVFDYHTTILVTRNPIMKSVMLSCIMR